MDSPVNVTEVGSSASYHRQLAERVGRGSAAPDRPPSPRPPLLPVGALRYPRGCARRSATTMPATSASCCLLALLLLAAAAAGAPVRYDQRQEGDFNVHAHLENFVVVLIPTSGGSGGGLGIVDFLKKAGANVRTAEQPIQDGPSPKGTSQDQHSLASKASEVAVVGVPPKDEEQRKEDPQLEAQQQQQQQREAQEEDLQPAGSEAMEAVLVAESPALLLARAGAGHHHQQQQQQQEQQQQQRGARAMGGAGDGCPQGQFRDATGVCHYIGSDQRVGEQYYLGLEPPPEN